MEAYRARLKRQNALLWALLIASVAYVVIMGEVSSRSEYMLDSRTWTRDMTYMQGVLFIWQGWAIWCIARNRRLSRDALRLRAHMVLSDDERIAAIKGMAGRRFAFILCALLSMAAITATFFDVKVFYALYGTLLCALALWAGLYLYYRKRT